MLFKPKKQIPYLGTFVRLKILNLKTKTMANLISLTVWQDTNGNTRTAAQVQAIAVARIFRSVPDTSVANCNARVDLQYQTNNTLRSNSIYVAETSAAITTAAALTPLTVWSDIDGSVRTTSQTQGILPTRIYRATPDTTVANSNSKIELQYQTNNTLQSRFIYVAETPAQVITAAG